jgi:hypothetical protein
MSKAPLGAAAHEKLRLPPKQETPYNRLACFYGASQKLMVDEGVL